MNIHFHDELYKGPLDALYLDDLHTFDVRGFDKNTMVAHIRHLIEDMILASKPVILSDTDGFCIADLEGQRAVIRDIYEEFSTEVDVITPFVKGMPPHWHFIPFEVDPDTINRNLTPLPHRPYILRYVGNEYYRSSILPLLDKLSNYGRVQVAGAGWKKHQAAHPNIEWSPKLPMTPSSVISTYSQSKFGYVGISDYNRGHDQVLYLYRWKEYLTAGTFIITESLPEFTSLMPFSVSQDDIMQNPDMVIHLTTSPDIEGYVQSVNTQREALLQFFGVDTWLPIFEGLIGL